MSFILDSNTEARRSMKVYLRKLTNNDTKRQIETTVESFYDFFGGNQETKEVRVSLSAPNGETEEFRISFAQGKANSLRFSAFNDSGPSLSNFIKNNVSDYNANDILKISKQGSQNIVNIIKSTDNDYIVLSGLIESRQNTVVVSDDQNLLGSTETNSINYETKYSSTVSRNYNRIFFGAPGTGKSFELDNQKNELLDGTEGRFERVTFHPDYTYSQFVGTYKPVPKTDGDGITYKYVPGPFMRILVEALRNSESENPYLLIIEEINRANVASVFGDIFQLLDRKNGISEYAINLSEDMKGYIINEFSKSGVEINPADLTELKLPNNLFIWATMNSADQGVFLMDTAFKRRWEFERFGINDNEEKISDYVTGYGLNWNALRKTINDTLSANSFKINEDKLMGPFFLKPESVLENVETKILNSKEFNSIFKNKVLMYLFDDAVKQKRAQFFDDGLTRYSQICEQFDKNFDEDGKLKDGTELKDVFSIFRNSESLFNDYQNFLSSTQNS